VTSHGYSTLISSKKYFERQVSDPVSGGGFFFKSLHQLQSDMGDQTLLCQAKRCRLPPFFFVREEAYIFWLGRNS
jgi:hypothetical protein